MLEKHGIDGELRPQRSEDRSILPHESYTGCVYSDKLKGAHFSKGYDRAQPEVGGQCPMSVDSPDWSGSCQSA